MSDAQPSPSSGHISAEDEERSRRRRAGMDRLGWSTLPVFCCGDCGWYSTDRADCPGCGQIAPAVEYERKALRS